MEMLSLAFTGPKALVMPRISRTTGASACAPVVAPPASLSVNWGPLLRAAGDLDVAVYDPLLGLLDLVLDFLGHLIVEAAERRQANALVVQPERDDLAAGELAFAGILDGLEHGVVHPLDHGGQDGSVGEELGLICVDADGEDALLTRRLEESRAGAARGVVDDVRALVYLLQADLLASRWVVEGIGCRTRILHQDLTVRADRLHTGLVAGLEPADQIRLLPAEETDDLVVGVGVLGLFLGHETGHHAREITALLLPEDQARRVLRLDDRVNYGEFGVGVLQGYLVDRVGHEEPDGEDGIVPRVGELGEVVHVVGRCARLEILGVHVELLLGPLQPGVGRVVEALVAKAADVQHQRRAHLGLTTAAAATLTSASLTSGATDRQQRQGQNRRDQDRCYAHMTSFSMDPTGRSAPYRFAVL